MEFEFQTVLQQFRYQPLTWKNIFLKRQRCITLDKPIFQSRFKRFLKIVKATHVVNVCMFCGRGYWYIISLSQLKQWIRKQSIKSKENGQLIKWGLLKKQEWGKMSVVNRTQNIRINTSKILLKIDIFFSYPFSLSFGCH